MCIVCVFGGVQSMCDRIDAWHGENKDGIDLEIHVNLCTIINVWCAVLSRIQRIDDR